MERLKNCNIIIDIEDIETISGTAQSYEVVFLAKDGIRYKLIFDFVWDFRCATENAYIDRWSKFARDGVRKSSVLLIENSEYIKYFENQASGTRPINELKNYIIFDGIDTIVEVLTNRAPQLLRI